VHPDPHAIVVVAAVIQDGHCFLLTRRPSGTHLAGMWEFPGGKVDPGETHAEALRRELLEELDAVVDIGERLYWTRHPYPDRTIELSFYRAALRSEPRPLLGQEMRWVPRMELASLGFPPADTELIEMLTRSDAR
jgi:8-oxo-dGTP diphosphatase